MTTEVVGTLKGPVYSVRQLQTNTKKKKTLFSRPFQNLISKALQKTSIQHLHPLHARIGRMCEGEKGARDRTSLSGSFFIPSTTISAAFHVKNQVQHWEFLSGEIGKGGLSSQYLNVVQRGTSF